MRISNFDELTEVAYKMAVDKGWYSDVPVGGKRDRLDVFNNFHSEVSEAWEEYRANRILPWYKGDDGARVVVPYESISEFPAGKKPEGFGVEIADYLIRLADFAGSIGLTKVGQLDGGEASVILDMTNREIVAYLHSITTKLLDFQPIESVSGEAFRIGVKRVCLVSTNACVSFFGADIFWDLVNLKVQFNANRSWKHGGKIA